MEEKNRTVRFPAWQSILTALPIVIAVFVMSIVPAAVPFIVIVPLAGIVLWFVLIVTSYRREKVFLPLIGTIAESRA